MTGLKYTGERAEASGLTFLRARYARPGVGRFLNRDTLRADPFNAASSHAYLYSSPEPISQIDPTGMEPIMTGIDSVMAAMAGPGFMMWRHAAQATNGTALFPVSEPVGKVQRVLMQECKQYVTGFAVCEDMLARVILNRWQGGYSEVDPNIFFGGSQKESKDTPLTDELFIKWGFQEYSAYSVQDEQWPRFRDLLKAARSGEPNSRESISRAATDAIMVVNGQTAPPSLWNGEPLFNQGAGPDNGHCSNKGKGKFGCSFLGTVNQTSFYGVPN